MLNLPSTNRSSLFSPPYSNEVKTKLNLTDALNKQDAHQIPDFLFNADRQAKINSHLPPKALIDGGNTTLQEIAPKNRASIKSITLPIAKEAAKACTPETARAFFEHSCYAEFTPLNQVNEHSNYLFKPTLPSNIENLKYSKETEIKTKLTIALTALEIKHSDNGMFYNPKTGTIFLIVIKDNKLSASFGGLGSEACIEHKSTLQQKNIHMRMGLANTSAAAKDFLGGVPEAAKEAMKIGLILKEAAGKDYEPVVIGHSHGGGLAACAAKAAGIKGVLFNARPLGIGVRKEVEKFKSQQPVSRVEAKITAFIMKDDWVAHQSGILHRVACIFKKEKRPMSIAHETWEIPKSPYGAVENHNDIARPLLKIFNPEAFNKVKR